MTARRGEKKSSEALGTLLQLVLGIIGGVLICAMWLVFKPVTVLDDPPDADRTPTDRHEILYVRGRPGRGTQGARKQRAFLDRVPGEIVLAEEDVNQWLTSAYSAKDRTIPVPVTDFTLGPRVPAVRLVGNEMEIGLEVALDKEKGGRKVFAQARGGFISRNGRQVFAPRKIYLGSCPLPWNLGGKLLFEKLEALYPVSERVANAWSTLGEASVENSRLHLVVGGTTAPAPAPVVTAPVMTTPSAPAVAVPASPAPENPATSATAPAPGPTAIPADMTPPAPAEASPANTEQLAAPAPESATAPVGATETAESTEATATPTEATLEPAPPPSTDAATTAPATSPAPAPAAETPAQ